MNEATKITSTLLTWQEAAEALRIAETRKDPRRVIYRLGIRGELSVRKVGARLMVLRSSVERMVNGEA